MAEKLKLGTQKKEDLAAMAEARGLVVTEDMKRAEILALINSDIEASEAEKAEITAVASTVKDEQEESDGEAIKKAEAEEADIKKRLMEARAGNSMAGVLIVQWLKGTSAPDWYITLDERKGVENIKATEVPMDNGRGETMIYSFYRFPNTKKVREIFQTMVDSGEMAFIEAGSSVYDEIRMNLAMEDMKRKEQEARHKKLMRAEGIRGVK